MPYRTVKGWLGLRPWELHSQVLLVAGLGHLAMGLSLMLVEAPPNRYAALEVALRWMSFHGWGALFCLAGLLTIISTRWPPFTRRWGYMILTGLSGGWSAFYVLGIIFADSPVSNISGFITWALLSYLWWAISGLRNPGQEFPGGLDGEL